MVIPVKTRDGGYDIVMERGALARIGELLASLDGENAAPKATLVVTDDGVPAVYAETVAKAAGALGRAQILTLPQGEDHKSMESLSMILSALVELRATRKDRVIAVGGGVVGDMSGLAAALYMRGIDWINIPTTVLSQVDSSVGGKTAIDFAGVKNVVGAFYPPRMVVIDHDTLATLPARQVSNGLAEALKMSLTHDAGLFAMFENEDPLAHLDEICERAIRIKKYVVEEDERESGLRRVLNFGHTIGHGIELACGGALLHGECVAIGMAAMSSDAVRARLLPVLDKLKLPHEAACDAETVLELCAHDKKADGAGVVTVLCDEVGAFSFARMDEAALRERIAAVVKPDAGSERGIG
ncbi:MAG: 3-dehydroquinate synthase [Kiritimatiellae bacterium]|nr:3-dehydroquinate synthase [Kiritimatiellia bacterium]